MTKIKKIDNIINFSDFLLEPLKDFKLNKYMWENRTIDTYLESIANCLKDNQKLNDLNFYRAKLGECGQSI